MMSKLKPILITAAVSILAIFLYNKAQAKFSQLPPL